MSTLNQPVPVPAHPTHSGGAAPAGAPKKETDPFRAADAIHPASAPSPLVRVLRTVLVLLVVLAASVCVPAPEGVRADVPVKAAIMMNMTTGHILYQKNADMKIPPASLTKIMTSFLVHDAISQGRLSPGTRVRVSRSVSRVGGSTMDLRTGERVTIAKLLEGTIISSGNDAATALAIKTSGSQRAFVNAMNTKAAQLGMKSTRFRNPTGLPAAGQVTTARDMMRLTLAYLRKYPGAARIHGRRSYVHRGVRKTTTNPFLGQKSVNGFKTGFTLKSGYNIVLTTQRGGNRLLIVLLGASSKTRRSMAAGALLDAGLRYPNSPRLVRERVDGKSSRQLSTVRKQDGRKKAVVKKNVSKQPRKKGVVHKKARKSKAKRR